MNNKTSLILKRRIDSKKHWFFYLECCSCSLTPFLCGFHRGLKSLLESLNHSLDVAYVLARARGQKVIGVMTGVIGIFSNVSNKMLSNVKQSKPQAPWFCFMPEKSASKTIGIFVERFVDHIAREVFTQTFGRSKNRLLPRRCASELVACPSELLHQRLL